MKPKQILLKAIILLVVFYTKTSYSQLPIIWQKSFGGSNDEYSDNVCITKDGGYILVATAQSNDGDVVGIHNIPGAFGGPFADAWIIKLDSKGKIEWQKCLGQLRTDTRSFFIKQAKDGGYILGGEQYTSFSPTSTNFWIAKLKSKGELEWEKTYGGSRNDIPYSIVETDDGGYAVTGETESNDGDVSGNHGKFDGWVVKLNSMGSMEWQKCIGGGGSDAAYSIVQSDDGGYVLAGVKDEDKGDAYIVKLKSNGEQEWEKSYGGSSTDIAQCIQKTIDGGYIVASTAYSDDGDVKKNRGHGDYWVFKLKSNGELEWGKTYGGSGDDQANSIIQTSAGNYIVAGQSKSSDENVSKNYGKSDYWIVKLDNTEAIGKAPNIEWQKCLGGSGDDLAMSVIQTKDSGYCVLGYSKSNDGDVTGNHGNEDYWIVKLDNTGRKGINGAAGTPPNIEWQKSLGSPGVDYGYSLIQTTDGGYILAGTGYSNGGDITGNHGDDDYWVVKLDNSGKLNTAPKIEWQKSLGGSGLDLCFSMSPTNDGGYILGGYAYSVDGDVTGSNGAPDYWIVKLDNTAKPPINGAQFGTPPNIEWQKCLGGSSFDWGFVAKPTRDGGYVMIGVAQSTDKDATPMPGDFGYHGGGGDYWIVKLGPPLIETCPNNTKMFMANLRANLYQWQLDNGSGFINITDNANYVGTSSDILQLKNIPSSWNGYKYRCVLNGGGQYSSIITLKISSYWNGTVDNKWETAGNWSCGILPDEYTDVYINSGKLRYPQVTQAVTAKCKSLTISPGTSLNINKFTNIRIYGH